MQSEDTGGEVGVKLHPSAEKLIWEQLNDSAIPEVYRIHLAACQSLEDGIIRQDPEEKFRLSLREGGALIGARAHHGTLVGYGVAAFDTPIKHSISALLALNGEEDGRLAILDGAAVLPDWRGHGLYAAILLQRIALARRRACSLLALTTSPRNTPCLRALLRHGFQIRCAAIMYGGLERLVLVRDLLQPPGDWLAINLVSQTDYAGHVQACQAGLQGWRALPDARGTLQVQYGCHRPAS